MPYITDHFAAIVGSTIILYREGDADSLDFANFYRLAHDIPEGNIVAVPCSADEILASYADFVEQVEAAVEEVADLQTVRVVVVGYNVPGGFHDGDDVVSTTSRLSRLGHVFAKNTPNPLFDRKGSLAFDADDFEVAVLCSRIDAPSLEEAKQMVAAGVLAARQEVANGTFHIDPYPVAAGGMYSEELTEFVVRTLPLLNLDVLSTVSPDTYADLIIPFLEDDCFMWATGAESSSDSFFRTTGAARRFLYNADSAGAATVRNAAGRRWPLLAIRNGYAATAGSMSAVSESHFLRPRPFFESLLEGGVVGEAYLFSVPYLDSPETLLGDPLVSTSFPNGATRPTLTTAALAVDLAVEQLSQAVGAVYAKQRLAQEVLDEIVLASDIETSVKLVVAADTLAKAAANAHVQLLQKAAPLVFAPLLPPRQMYPTAEQVEDYLRDNGYSVGSLFADAFAARGGVLSSGVIAEEGSWRFEFELVDEEPAEQSLYHFELDVATDPHFDDVVVAKDSATDPTGWSYQREVGTLDGLPAAGLGGNFSGRIVRYAAADGEKLDRGVRYFVRYRQKRGGEPFEYGTGTMVVHT
jgi:uncharacterized protein (TIGR03790 family)